jgi:hypothetical protein
VWKNDGKTCGDTVPNLFFISTLPENIVDFLPHLRIIQRFLKIGSDPFALRHKVRPLLKQCELKFLSPVLLTVDPEQNDAVTDRHA